MIISLIPRCVKIEVCSRLFLFLLEKTNKQKAEDAKMALNLYRGISLVGTTINNLNIIMKIASIATAYSINGAALYLFITFLLKNNPNINVFFDISKKSIINYRKTFIIKTLQLYNYMCQQSFDIYINTNKYAKISKKCKYYYKYLYNYILPCDKMQLNICISDVNYMCNTIDYKNNEIDEILITLNNNDNNIKSIQNNNYITLKEDTIHNYNYNNTNNKKLIQNNDYILLKDNTIHNYNNITNNKKVIQNNDGISIKDNNNIKQDIYLKNDKNKSNYEDKKININLIDDIINSIT
jgi:hypothetical protein